jgi:hypothetical protein|tara:strand:- start:102 stop:296 length:195 start_codon:yes stop_codon:yes gene_type:complete
MSSKWHGGKGDVRRKGANDTKYSKGYDSIFNKPALENMNNIIEGIEPTVVLKKKKVNLKINKDK